MIKRQKRKGEFETELSIQKKILREVLKMAKTLADLQTAIAAISDAVDADVEQDKEVVRVAKVLIDKIKGMPNSQDLETEVNALSAATAKLSSDNQAVKDALDEAGTV